MASGRIIKAAIAGLGFCVVMAQTARAGSAANDYVTVSASGVTVEADGDNFNIFAPGKDDGFTADVSVSAVGDWILIKPEASELPLKMKGGSSAGYEVEDDKENDGGGSIDFYNYYIKSNHDDGAKNIVVKAGESVTYTAHKNGKSCPSDWNVNGQTKKGTASIIFNRSFWNVSAWFIPSMNTPKAGEYAINAHDVEYEILSDSGTMIVVGIKNVTGGGKTSEKENAGELTNAETIVTEKGGAVALTATPEPSVAWPYGTPTWSASCGFWCVLGDHFNGDTAGQATVNVNTSNPDVIVVTAKCGTSQKCIKVISYELDFAISKNSLTLKHDCDTQFTVTAEPSSVIPTPTVQIKRNDLGSAKWPDWMDLLSGRGTINWKGRVAGKFQLRAKAEIAGEECLSDEKELTVQFPVFAQIVADSTVGSSMSREWQQTLDDCTGPEDLNAQPPIYNQRRERGFWVSLDTGGNGAYSCGNSIEGDLVGPNTGASVRLGLRPDPKLSDIAPNAQAANYFVASFHTHTPSTYRRGTRPIGPSQSDFRHSSVNNIAGIVYDYIVNSVGGNPKDSETKLYSSGNQRSITRE